VMLCESSACPSGDGSAARSQHDFSSN
jgi:hypothetical protein